MANFAATADFEASLVTNTASGDGDDELAGLEGLRANSTQDLTIEGNDGNNILIAGVPEGHTSTVRGLEGNDHITVEPVADKGEAGDSMLLGGAGADLIDGGCQSLKGGRDRIEGGGGRDRLDGGCGVDELLGGAGHDTLQATGDKGRDMLDGGGGFDFAAFKEWGNRVVADLTKGEARVHYPGDKVSGLISLTEIEGLKGGSQPGNDTLIGDDGPNRILGLGGDDTIKGKGGDDKLDGGNGRDRLNGGGGRDRCSAAERRRGCES
jgi:Ca2+-binding RTX toxin-like protein